MRVLYLLTSPQPIIAGTDAAFQEVSALKAAFNGETVNLCPWATPGRPYPPQLFGFHRLPEIRRLERRCEINHVFHSVPYRFPVLRFLRNPVVYTVLASVRQLQKPPSLIWLASLHRIVVSNPRDADTLKSWGLSNFAVVPPAIETGRLEPSALPLADEMTLLMASAPWAEDQFDLKGVDALLDAVARLPKLRLILLWRGLLLKELLERVERRALKNRVEIIPERVDINVYLRRVHATVLAAKRGDIVKAYPHSLLESLAAGKPVILSDALPMADYVRQRECGIVIEEVSEQTLVLAIEDLRARYETLAQRARLTDAQSFSQQAMIASYREIYRLGDAPANAKPA
jgi:glycosyltransferase involved in cell wall biosynthesis